MTKYQTTRRKKKEVCENYPSSQRSWDPKQNKQVNPPGYKASPSSTGGGPGSISNFTIQVSLLA